MIQSVTDWKMNSGAYYVYILASKRNGTLYIGVTNDLLRRVHQHKNNLVAGFTKRHAVHKLVWYDCTYDIGAAIQMEKRLKKYPRKRKLNLIEKDNPNWNDLWEGINKA